MHPFGAPFTFPAAGDYADDTRGTTWVEFPPVTPVGRNRHMTLQASPADVVIIGAGAAGLATAIFTARANPQLRIVVLDGAKKIGAKILVSGGGRCNVTNVRVDAEDFRGASLNSIRKILRSFTAADAADFFHELGVSLHEEEHGKLFPDSNDAQSVLTALVVEAARLNIDLRTEHRVSAVERGADGFRVVTNQGALNSHRVVLATGGKSLPKTGSDGAGYELARSLGHTITAPVPALVPLILNGEFHARLSGIAHEAALTVRVQASKPVTHFGALLWTHFGVSGPVVLDASGLFARARAEGTEVTVSLNFLPGKSFESCEQWMLSTTENSPRESLRSVLGQALPARVADALLAAMNIDPQVAMGRLLKDARRRMIHALLEWPLPIVGDRGYNYAEVTAGGVPLEEVNVGSMESRIAPRLFLVGEILNVDGRIGGFNFQWAWSTAAVAGRALGASCK